MGGPTYIRAANVGYSQDRFCAVLLTKRSKGRRNNTTTNIPSDADRDFVLLEKKALYQRKPNGRIPRYYKPQIWMGLDLSLVASLVRPCCDLSPSKEGCTLVDLYGDI